MDLSKYENFLNQKKATQELLKSKMSKLGTSIEGHKAHLKNLEEALDIMNTVGTLVQQEFEEVVEELVTQALRFVFGDSYSFEVESKISRNQPEINLYINVDGERYIPEDDSSGGEMDVASFALRVILWAIQYDRTEATLLCDEPFRNVDPNKLPCLREMVRYLSDMLGIQFIIVTHSPELAGGANRSFAVVREKGISKVKLL
jgi:DNA repair exonuclease SbcCD ATPase subunit